MWAWDKRKGGKSDSIPVVCTAIFKLVHMGEDGMDGSQGSSETQDACIWDRQGNMGKRLMYGLEVPDPKKNKVNALSAVMLPTENRSRPIKHKRAQVDSL